jgi:hypothetical protein
MHGEAIMQSENAHASVSEMSATYKAGLDMHTSRDVAEASPPVPRERRQLSRDYNVVLSSLSTPRGWKNQSPL